MPSKGKYEDQREILAELAASGASLDEMSSETGIPSGSIYHYLRKWDIDRQVSRGNYDKFQYEIEESIGNGLSWAEIQRRTGIDRSTLYHLGNKWRLRVSHGGKYADKRDTVESRLRAGKAITEVSDETGIPLGSMGYLLEKWGLGDLQFRRSSGEWHTDTGKKSMSESMRKRHAAGFKTGGKHHFANLLLVRGSWLSYEEVKIELEHYVAADLTLSQMAEGMGVDSRSITNRLKKFGLQTGMRSGSRCSWYKGGYRKGRGPDWLERREEALERDNHECQHCGIGEEVASEQGHTLSIHHIIPWEESFDNSLENLVTLCQSCHMKEEWRNGRWRFDRKT